jgi:hypothetical protein
MLRLVAIAFWTLLPLPAVAAATWEDELFNWLAVFIVGGIPAAGVAYVLGSFLRLPASILILAALALAPTGLLWASRGFESAAGFAWRPFVMLIIFSPLILIGFQFGCRDATRHTARKSLLQNGD